MIGEYIKTEDGIFKITELDIGERIVFVKGDKGISYNYPKREFLKYKHSKNKMDLIEEGDYVNGYRILEKTKIKNNEMQICILKDNNCSNWRTINEKTLKSIVTKEQFASMEYRVKEEIC